MKSIYAVLFSFIFAFACSSEKNSEESTTRTEEDIEGTKLATTKAIDKQNEVVETNKTHFIKDTEGNYYNLEDFKGKRVFLNFWATWCKPCIAEMPSIERTAALLEKENYVFLLVSDQPMSKIAAFEEKMGFNLKFAKLNGTMDDLKIRSLPTTFIYDTEGSKVKQISGSVEWDNENMLNKLKAIN